MSKTAIVTGGATGIGKAISSLLCLNGYNVIINYNRSEDAANKLANSLTSNSCLSAVTYKADISQKQEADALIKFAESNFGHLDLLVCNAGIAQQKLFTDITPEDWSRMMSVNLSGCFNCCQSASSSMLKRHSGCIINISSMWGITGASCEVHYSAAKAGVIGLTKALAKELGPSGIRVNCVAPGVIKTDMLKSFSDDELKDLAESIPLCRLGTPEDVAEAVLFLASDKASFITGQTLSVDGGFVI